jgi:hemolysin activation/secretion protein
MRRAPSRRWALPAALASACAAAHAAQAQGRPDAGQVAREQWRDHAAPRPPPKAAPDIALPRAPTAPAPAGGEVIAVSGFRVSGATAFPADQLGGLLRAWRGRGLTLGELRDAADRITRHYHEHGYLLARAYLPAQTLQDGVVVIAVLEGRVGAVVLQASSAAALRQARALAEQITPGALAQEAQLERMLLLLNERPGIAGARAALQPGASVGLSDLVVTLEAGPAASGELEASNHGNRYTGSYLAGAAVSLTSPIHAGDQFSARVQGSDARLYYARLSYRVPLGGDGFAAGAAWSSSRYRLGRSFAPLDAHGDARIAGVFASYPLVLSRTLKLSAVAAFDDKALRDRVDALSSETRKRIRLGSVGVSASVRLQSGTYSASIAGSAGRLDIESADALANDAATVRGNGHFDKLNYSASAALPIGTAWLFSARLSGQRAGKNLDSAEKFPLGGADGVRAYPQGEAAADDGLLVSVALYRALPSRGTAAPAGAGEALLGCFVDAGLARIDHSPFGGGEHRRRLSAIGLSLDYPLPGRVQLQASLAWKLGRIDANPDNDQRLRAWLMATRYF